uniref:Uncharacterized protein n=1 Tax=Branchiostoma floridae TaxID=7739 RepID=C3ZUI5_BRAFL|eukprot:XP_002587813.1 hypothetical protein BRAFLDRAFT_92262 [Branchiostoma floridae]
MVGLHEGDIYKEWSRKKKSFEEDRNEDDASTKNTTISGRVGWIGHRRGKLYGLAGGLFGSRRIVVQATIPFVRLLPGPVQAEAGGGRLLYCGISQTLTAGGTWHRLSRSLGNVPRGAVVRVHIEVDVPGDAILLCYGPWLLVELVFTPDTTGRVAWVAPPVTVLSISGKVVTQLYPKLFNFSGLKNISRYTKF